jgi:hypothetical protein
VNYIYNVCSAPVKEQMSRVQSRLRKGIDIIHMKYGTHSRATGSERHCAKSFCSNVSPFVSFFVENVTSLHHQKKLPLRVEFHGRLERVIATRLKWSDPLKKKQSAVKRRIPGKCAKYDK